MNPFNLVQGIGVVISTIKGFPRDTVTIYGEAENLLINPDEIINQKDFDGNWAGIAVGVYGPDMWRRGVSALTKEQPIINTSIHAGKHTLSWDGGGDGDVTQSSASVGSGASPLTVTLADQTQVEVIVPEGATNPQFVEGDIVRPTRRRTKEEELDKCFTYCWRQTGIITVLFPADTSGRFGGTSISFPKRMRISPSSALFGSPTYILASSDATTQKVGRENFRFQCISTAASAAVQAEMAGDDNNYYLFEAWLT